MQLAYLQLLISNLKQVVFCCILVLPGFKLMLIKQHRLYLSLFYFVDVEVWLHEHTYLLFGSNWPLYHSWRQKGWFLIIDCFSWWKLIESGFVVEFGLNNWLPHLIKLISRLSIQPLSYICKLARVSQVCKHKSVALQIVRDWGHDLLVYWLFKGKIN